MVNNKQTLSELVRIYSTTKALLDSIKLVQSETYDSVIIRLIDKKNAMEKRTKR
jgi:hypothetical protein